jgi:hypothetical protein
MKESVLRKALGSPATFFNILYELNAKLGGENRGLSLAYNRPRVISAVAYPFTTTDATTLITVQAS